MKKFVIQFFLLIIVTGVAIYFVKPGGNTINLSFFPQSKKTTILQINGNNIKVEIADTKEKRNKGLGGREALATDSGMLFIFDKPAKYSFWMKGMKFGLDLIFIRENEVVDIIQNVLPPQIGEKDENLHIYMSKTEVDKVLEVPSGTAKNLGFQEGDIVKF